MAKFKVGDRVEVISTKHNTDVSIGDKGTVLREDFRVCDDSNYAVRMDRKNPHYHSCLGLVPWGYGQNFWGECLKLIDDKPTREFKLIITSKGDTTTAKLIHGERTVVKEATVTRYSKDEYSEKAAVEAVVKKIFDKDEEDEKKGELFNGKAVLISGEHMYFTKGKIYVFKNGNCVNDRGNIVKLEHTKQSIEHSDYFLPIIE